MEGLGVKIFLTVIGVVLFLEAAQASSGGFSLDLIHRDSPHSPFFDPSKTPTERLTDNFQLYVPRVGGFRQRAMAPDGGIQSILVTSPWEYFMSLSIGTPPVPIIATVDTGSDLTWTQCRPCNHCYEQVLPFYDPRKSSTYTDSSCGTTSCLALGKDGLCSKEKHCTFNYSYADSSFTGGNLATDTLTVSSAAGKPVSFPGFVFGCGDNNGGIFDNRSSGIVGLGRGKLSMISQLKSTIKGRFSYCLQPISTNPSVTGRINFGDSSVVSGPRTVSTPLVRKGQDTYYYVTLEALSVGKTTLPFKTTFSNKAQVEEGNIIIDSGTSLTYLPKEFYSKLEKSVVNSINKEKRVKDPNGIFSLCYNTTRNINAPIITAHFRDANVQLPPLNTFLRVEEDLVCFTLVPTSDIGVFGNKAQVNFLIGFDLNKKRVSFKPTDCSHSIRTVGSIGVGWVVWKIFIINFILYSVRYLWM